MGIICLIPRRITYYALAWNLKIVVNEFTVAHIFFDPKKPGGPEAALTRARDGYQKIKNGESFDKLAEKISEDPNFSAGGLLGTFKAGEFLPEIEARVATLKPGEVSDVVKSRIGFHLVKLISKKLATDPKFEKEKEFLKRKIEMVSIQKQFRNWLEKKKDDIAIKINEKK
jgi:peptidyl-prolyl cis-trans isomerase SurA